MTLPIAQQQSFDTTHTTHGFTGHEGADKVGLIHMNGRMYDPVLGRFIQADSIVQDPYDPQSLNRYAYVLNNPLTATDPSGNISFKNGLKLVAAIVITVYTAGAASGTLSIFGFTATTTAGGLATVAAGGALAGAITGGAKGALTGAFTAAAFFGVGEAFTNIGNAQSLAQAGDVTQGLSKAGLTAGQTVAKIAAHGAVGGAMGVLQGGKFGHGFVTAGLNESLSGKIGQIGNTGGQVAASAILGGTTSSLVGGKFANGAITAAFATAFSNIASRVASDSLADPTTVLDEFRRNRAMRDNIAVACDDSGCDLNIGLKVSADATLTDETFAWAMKDIARTWRGSYVYGERSYSITVSLTVDGRHPDIVFTTATLRAEDDGILPAGRSGLGSGKRIELGTVRSGTAAHELGHVLGLGHRRNFTGSIMSYADRRFVTGQEVDTLATGYGRKK